MMTILVEVSVCLRQLRHGVKIPITARVHEARVSISRGLKGGRLVLISVAPHRTQV
jgi:hypothetical protein